MKKIILILILLLPTFLFSQILGKPSKFYFGVKFPNQTLETSTDSLMLPVFDQDSVLNSFIYKKDIITDAQIDWIRSQMYSNHNTSFSVSPSQGERGISVAVSVNYNIVSNDDEFTSASINQGIGSVLANIDTGAKSASGGNRTASTTFTLSLEYDRAGTPETENRNATYTSRVPQWSGWSSKEDFADDYTEINSEPDFQKYIQSNSSITKNVSPEGQYVWFIVTNGTGQVFDGNNFVQSVGPWGDGVSEFYRKSLALTLADGTTTATVYLIRSRTVKTLSNFTYRTN